MKSGFVRDFLRSAFTNPSKKNADFSKTVVVSQQQQQYPQQLNKKEHDLSQNQSKNPQHTKVRATQLLPRTSLAKRKSSSPNTSNDQCPILKNSRNASSVQDNNTDNTCSKTASSAESNQNSTTNCGNLTNSELPNTLEPEKTKTRNDATTTVCLENTKFQTSDESSEQTSENAISNDVQSSSEPKTNTNSRSRLQTQPSLPVTKTRAGVYSRTNNHIQPSESESRRSSAASNASSSSSVISRRKSSLPSSTKSVNGASQLTQQVSSSTTVISSRLQKNKQFGGKSRLSLGGAVHNSSLTSNARLTTKLQRRSLAPTEINSHHSPTTRELIHDNDLNKLRRQMKQEAHARREEEKRKLQVSVLYYAMFPL